MTAKYPSDQQDKFMLRLPAGMRPRIAQEASKNKRSMNAEIIHRVDESFSDSPVTARDWMSAASLSPDKRAVLLCRVGGLAWSRARVATFSAGHWWTNNEPIPDLYARIHEYVWMDLPSLPE